MMMHVSVDVWCGVWCRGVWCVGGKGSGLAGWKIWWGQGTCPTQQRVRPWYETPKVLGCALSSAMVTPFRNPAEICKRLVRDEIQTPTRQDEGHEVEKRQGK